MSEAYPEVSITAPRCELCSRRAISTCGGPPLRGASEARAKPPLGERSPLVEGQRSWPKFAAEARPLIQSSSEIINY